MHVFCVSYNFYFFFKLVVVIKINKMYDRFIFILNYKPSENFNFNFNFILPTVNTDYIRQARIRITYVSNAFLYQDKSSNMPINNTCLGQINL